MQRKILGILLLLTASLSTACMLAFNEESTNADLSALTVSAGTLNPAFSAATTAYTVDVENTVNAITVSAITANENAALAISPSQPCDLLVGENAITITVTAESGATKAYTVAVTRALSPNADLIALTVSEGALSPAFSAATTAYSVEVLNAVTAITVTATPAEATATVLISPAQPAALILGLNTITVTVTAASGASKAYSIIVNRTADYISSYIGTLKYVPAGTFQRDATASNISTVTTAFRMSACEITMEQFVAVTGLLNPSSSFTGVVNGPVQYTNWYHALVFCNKLSIAEGLTPVYSIQGSTVPDAWDGTTDGTIAVPTTSDANWDTAVCNWSANGYRLPTEMEWMWAAMGATSDRSNGYTGSGINTTGYTKGYAGSIESAGAQVNIGNYAWYTTNSDSTTHTVGTAGITGYPNELGLYDMSGNVYEWCWDWDAAYPSGTLMSDAADNSGRGAASGGERVCRGGNWGDMAFRATVAYRDKGYPYGQGSIFGFRVVRP